MRPKQSIKECREREIVHNDFILVHLKPRGYIQSSDSNLNPSFHYMISSYRQTASRLPQEDLHPYTLLQRIPFLKSSNSQKFTQRKICYNNTTCNNQYHANTQDNMQQQKVLENLENQFCRI